MKIFAQVDRAIANSIHCDRIEVIEDQAMTFDTHDDLASYIDDCVPDVAEVMGHHDQVTGLRGGHPFAVRLGPRN